MANPFGKKPPIRDAQHYPNLFRSVRTRRNKFWGRWYGWVASVLAFLIVAGGAWGLWYYNALESAGQVDIKGTEDVPEGKPKNVLLVGSDSREGLTEEEQLDLGAAAVGGERADTLIVAHIDPATSRVVMVQFPRDYYITYPDGHQDRINAGLINGRPYMINAVENLTGLNINDYVQVNIAGFRDLVDAIGGVEICLTEAIPYSSATGIEVTEEEVPGMVEFDGERAIRFVRERKAFAGGDFARIQNQQRFLAAAIEKLTSVGTILRPDKLLDIKDVVSKNVRFSETLNLREIRKLANQLSNVNPDTYEVYEAPNFGTMTTAGGASVVEPDLESMHYLFDKIAKNELPSDDGVPDINPSEITVGVYNGTGIDGAASNGAAELIAATQTDQGQIDVPAEAIADADRGDYGRSRIVYEPEDRKKAEYLAAALPKARLEEGKTRAGIDVAVIVGAAFEPEPIVQVTPLDIPEPGAVPEACR